MCHGEEERRRVNTIHQALTHSQFVMCWAPEMSHYINFDMQSGAQMGWVQRGVQISVSRGVIIRPTGGGGGVFLRRKGLLMGCLEVSHGDAVKAIPNLLNSGRSNRSICPSTTPPPKPVPVSSGEGVAFTSSTTTTV